MDKQSGQKRAEYSMTMEIIKRNGIRKHKDKERSWKRKYEMKKEDTHLLTPRDWCTTRSAGI